MSNVDTSNKSKEKKKRRRNKVDGNENALKYWEQRLLKWGLEQVRLSNESPNFNHKRKLRFYFCIFLELLKKCRKLLEMWKYDCFTGL